MADQPGRVRAHTDPPGMPCGNYFVAVVTLVAVVVVMVFRGALR